MKKRKILLYPLNEKRHTLYNSIIEILSKKYELIYNPVEKKKNNFGTNKIELFKTKRFRKFYYEYVFPIASLNEIKDIFRKKRQQILPDADLIYSANQIPPGDKPYIIDIENISALNGYAYNRLDKKKIKSELESDRCKAIICWNKDSEESVYRTIESKKIMKKMVTIPFAIKSSKVRKNFNNDAKLLFVSSVNNPDDFDMKGGEITLECFKILKKKYKKIKLNIRARVPENIINKYKNIDGINFITNTLSDKEMKKLFLESDLLVEPLPGLNLMLDCFNYKVPIVCLDFWFMREMIKDAENGLLIESDEYFQKDDYDTYLKNIRINFIRLADKKVINEFALKFAEKSKILLNNKQLRKKFSDISKKMLSGNGSYSINKRNSVLLRLFEKCLGKNI